MSYSQDKLNKQIILLVRKLVKEKPADYDKKYVEKLLDKIPNGQCHGYAIAYLSLGDDYVKYLELLLNWDGHLSSLSSQDRTKLICFSEFVIFYQSPKLLGNVDNKYKQLNFTHYLDILPKDDKKIKSAPFMLCRTSGHFSKHQFVRLLKYIFTQAKGEVNILLSARRHSTAVKFKNRAVYYYDSNFKNYHRCFDNTKFDKLIDAIFRAHSSKKVISLEMELQAFTFSKKINDLISIKGLLSTFHNEMLFDKSLNKTLSYLLTECNEKEIVEVIEGFDIEEANIVKALIENLGEYIDGKTSLFEFIRVHSSRTFKKLLKNSITMPGTHKAWLSQSKSQYIKGLPIIHYLSLHAQKFLESFIDIVSRSESATNILFELCTQHDSDNHNGLEYLLDYSNVSFLKILNSIDSDPDVSSKLLKLLVTKSNGTESLFDYANKKSPETLTRICALLCKTPSELAVKLNYSEATQNNYELNFSVNNASSSKQATLVITSHNMENALRAISATHMTDLCMAANFGLIDEVQTLLEHGADIDEKDKGTGKSALQLATEKGHISVIQTLLTHYQPGNQVEWASTPLYVAGLYDNQDLWARLLKYTNINALDDKGFALIHVAAIQGDLIVAEKLLNAGAMIDKVGAERWTALHYAVRYEHAEIVELLVNKGASVNKQNGFNATPLHLAASIYSNQSKKIIRYLLNQSPNINLKDSDELTPLGVATRDKRTDNFIQIAEYCEKKNGGKWNPLHYAVNYGNSDAVFKLLQTTVSWQQTKNGDSPLHLALRSKRKNRNDIVDILLDKNDMIIDYANQNGETPLHAAIKNNIDNDIIVRILEGTTKEINTRVDNRFTPLYLAALHRNEEVFKQLLKKSANVNNQNKDGVSLLHIAAEHQEMTVILKLLNNNCKIDIQDRNGWTPLHIAVFYGNVEVVQVLLAHGADVNKKNC